MIAGIDGCRGGWIAVLWNKGDWSIHFHRTLLDFLASHDVPDKVMIDVPIGLTGGGITRDLEPVARQFLRVRASSVFTPPCRSAVYAFDYDEGRKRNLAETGNSLSIQAWNIVPKIRETDLLLRSSRGSSLKGTWYESHPEICYEVINNGQPLTFGKRAKNKQGYAERLALLPQELARVIDRSARTFPRKICGPDDIADAGVLCYSGHLSAKRGLNTIAGSATFDEKGLHMRMAYHN